MKKIIHIDADCFFAAVEMRENPNIANLPVAVGGDPNKRGVISTCNYQARVFGVKSAMSSAYARKLCPNLLIIPSRISLYKQYSDAMHAIFSEFTPYIEPLSLDEAYLDVSESEDFSGSATLIAEEIRDRIHREIGITVSAGVAPVKFLSKIASDWQKPNGLFVIPPDAVMSFVDPLPVRKLPGVGQVTAEKLARYGIYTCLDVRTYGLSKLIRQFGVFGRRLYEMSQGIDNRDVQARSNRKSMSVEHTFEHDVERLEDLMPELQELIERLTLRYSKLDSSYSIHTYMVKIKFSDFSQTTIETSARTRGVIDYESFARLVNAGWHRERKSVRLLGVGFRFKLDDVEQLLLPFGGDFPDEDSTQSE